VADAIRLRSPMGLAWRATLRRVSPVTAAKASRASSNRKLSNCGRHRINRITGALGEVVAAHPMFGLEMTDHRFDRSSPSQRPLDGLRDATLLSRGEHPQPRALGAL
jgi:hypothetical protein